VTNPYDRHHRKRRDALLPAALGTRCPGGVVGGRLYRSRRCVGIMTDPSRMHLDHTRALALGGTVGDRIICAPCNTGAGAALGNRLRGRRMVTPTRRVPAW
jgi:hypothetical protein